MRLMVPPISLMTATESLVAVCISVTCAPMSPVALAVCSASALTSWATTAKPRPASPARAASIVALSARRLVCSAISVISRTTSPIRLAAFASSEMRLSVFSACFTASIGIGAAFLHPARNLVDGGAHLFGGGGHRLDVCRCLFGCGGDHAGQVLRILGRAGQRAGGRFKIGRGIGHAVDDLADRGLEFIRELMHGRFLLGGRPLLECDALALDFADAQALLAEHRQGVADRADLVIAFGARQFQIELAVGHLPQGAGDPGQRHRHAIA